MCEIKNIGYIYKITNLINGKIYIGQTSKTIEERWSEHKSTAFRNNKESYLYPLYKAFRKYGVNNFKIEKIEKCEIKQLNEREIYWISYYNSYHNGYNATLGGEGFKTLELDEFDVIKKYYELGTIEGTSKYYNCHSQSIGTILKKHNIKTKTAQEIAKEKGFITYALDDNKKVFKEFFTLYEAGEWVFNNLKHNAKDAHSCKKSIIRAILKNNRAYGYYWKNDDYSGEYIEEWNKKQMDLKNKKEFKNLNLYGVKYKPRKNLCPICNKNMKDINSSCCKECNCLQTSKNYREEFEAKISKETLMQLVREKSFREIGKIYGVSDKTIIRWCQKYLIPCRKEDINKISDKDWKKECNLTKEEYESKYCQVKEKVKLSRTKVINTYKKIKTIKGTAKEFGVGEDRIRKILVDNNIKIFNSNKVTSESLGKVYRCDKETGEILESYNSMIEAVDWLYENNTTEAKRESLKKSISKAVNSVHNAYGYKWKRA